MLKAEDWLERSKLYLILVVGLHRPANEIARIGVDCFPEKTGQKYHKNNTSEDQSVASN